MLERSHPWQWSAHLVLTLCSIACIVPFLVLFSSSISNSSSIIQYGYSLLPRDFDLAAYHYLLNQSSSILNALGVTVLVTAMGTAVSLAISSLFAYPLSRRDLPGRKFLTLFVVFTLLFNGGLVPTYLIYTNVFHFKDSILALIVPNLLMNGFNVLMIRTFFMTTISEAIIESAAIDGAGEYRTLISIILPLSLPVLATIGLLTAISYWNDWFNALVYISRPQLLGLQAVLNQMINNINFLSTFTSSGGTVTPVVELPSTTVRMAVAFIGVLPFLAAYPFFQKYFVRGITVGAVKG
jgi:putative aldouronate transport system permease protein